MAMAYWIWLMCLSTSFFLGNGDGTFQTGIPFEGTFGLATVDSAFGDLNADGTVDLVQVGHAPNFQLGAPRFRKPPRCGSALRL